MFYNCTSLRTLDLSKWDVSSVEDMRAMFDGCDNSIIPDWYTDVNYVLSIEQK